MTMKRNRMGTQQRILLVALLIPLLLTLAVGVLSHRTSQTFRDSTQAVHDSLRISQKLEEVMSLVKDSEAGQRGYVLLAREELLEPHRHAASKVPGLLAELRHLLRASPAQHTRLQELEKTIALKLEQIERIIAWQGEGRGQEASAYIVSGEGLATMARIRELVGLMQQEQRELLLEEQENLALQVQLNTFTSYAVVVGDVILVSVIGCLLLRVRRMNQLVTVCAWTKTIRHEGRWITFEDYLRERFGLSVTHGISEAELERLAPEAEEPEPAAARR